tara:strand:- start:1046 stop:2737 length:1692 start_codon:yes stop_codon:yes gene_type:complete
MSTQTVNFLGLFKEKKYSTIISIIENKLTENQQTSGLLNLKGVCRLMISNSSESIKLAIEDFIKSYHKETDKTKLVETIKNLINASVILFDNEFRLNENELKKNFFDDIYFFYNQNKSFFEKNSDLMHNFTKVVARTSDSETVIKHLKKVFELNSNADAFISSIFWRNYNYGWSQKEYFNNSKKINDLIPLYNNDEFEQIINVRNDKLNIAFISSDIRGKHSIIYFLKSVINFYDKKKYNIFIYNNHNSLPEENKTIKEFENKVYKILDIKTLKDIEVINRIRKDKIDIIIDLNGLSSDHRLSLFKNRLAPVQISWCGYVNTTGLNEMDYLIADKNLIKQQEEKYYTEKIIYLKDIWNCHYGYGGLREFNLMPSVKKKFITFGSFNNFRKINDDVIEVWSKILKKVKNSKLILKTSFPISTERFKKKFDEYGVLKSVIILPFKKKFANHLEIYKDIDIALDTFPYNGVTTSFEAIWMGVPVVTMRGYNLNSRCGESINKNARLSKLIAEDKEDYVKKVVSLAQNEKELLTIRKNLFENVLETPLFDGKKFCDSFFSSLEKVYN